MLSHCPLYSAGYYEEVVSNCFTIVEERLRGATASQGIGADHMLLNLRPERAGRSCQKSTSLRDRTGKWKPSQIHISGIALCVALQSTQELSIERGPGQVSDLGRQPYGCC